MKLKKIRYLASIVLLCFTGAWAQDNFDLTTHCETDLDVVDFVFELSSDPDFSSELLSEESASQIKALLAREEHSGKEVGEKIQAVIDACSEARILQSRNRPFLEGSQ
ncbi:MAG: hypothetical protein AAF431_17595 [Pseudomonadota bacterium]